MTAVKFKFPPEAHTKYGDTWYELDLVTIEREVDCGILERFEDETGFMVGELPGLLARGSFRALRAAVWLAVLVSGRRDKWAYFKADAHTDPRYVTWHEAEEPEGEQSSPPPPSETDPLDSKEAESSSGT